MGIGGGDLGGVLLGRRRGVLCGSLLRMRGVLLEGEVWTVIFREVKLRNVLEMRDLRFSGEICVIFKSVQDGR